LSQGLERYASEQLEPGPDPELDARLAPLTTLGWSLQQVLAADDADRRSTARVLGELASAKMVRIAHARNQLGEVLTDFWFNHFNVNVRDGFLRFSTPSYERDAIRPHALGRFRDLLGATAQHPAMLYYLDNYLSTAEVTVGGRRRGGLNENYGRELLELHTLGNDAGYNQQDVVDAARCFTGWGIENPRRSGAFVFRAPLHDSGAKNVYGLSLPAGGGKDDGDRLLDHLASRPATARRVAWRTDPASRTWLSLTRMPASRPPRWGTPPPASTACFSRNRRSGVVLRVSRMRAPVPATASTNRRVSVATPERC